MENPESQTPNANEIPNPESRTPEPAVGVRGPGTGDLKDPRERMKQDVIDMIKTCYDPEIPVNIWELGLIYDVQASPAEGDVQVKMTLTSPSCPAAQSLPPEVEAKVKTVAGVKTAKVEVVWEPPWTPEKMSEAAKLELGVM